MPPQPTSTILLMLQHPVNSHATSAYQYHSTHASAPRQFTCHLSLPVPFYSCFSTPSIHMPPQPISTILLMLQHPVNSHATSAYQYHSTHASAPRQFTCHLSLSVPFYSCFSPPSIHM